MDNVVSPTVTALVALMKLKGVGRRAALQIIDGTDAQDRLRKFPRDGDVESGHGACSRKASCGARGSAARNSYRKALRRACRHSPTMTKNIRAGYGLFRTRPPYCSCAARRAAFMLQEHRRCWHTRADALWRSKLPRSPGRRPAEAGFAVVSGLAHGCDTYGHEGCLQGHGLGIAVLAHGLDRDISGSQ